MEGYRLKSDVTINCWHCMSIFCIPNFDGRIEQFQDPFTARHRGLKRIEAATQIADGIEEAVNVKHEGDQHTCCDRFTQDSRPADVNDKCSCDRAEHIHNWREQGGSFRCVYTRF